ncbi:hypothetical protein DERP_009087 [Dermatophagoides pteronyssinus]|uniref:Uncharacterized protein n=1 Tax=Dermatophagoides pteronyssinus TaxID=6956 RepID=A0ABQ8JQH2_DERPT|nr:hypothetical protein DERP_009087 [Dermatophagoides pteronyssinus]
MNENFKNKIRMTLCLYNEKCIVVVNVKQNHIADGKQLFYKFPHKGANKEGKEKVPQKELAKQSEHVHFQHSISSSCGRLNIEDIMIE